jgi:cob(I)alamin adenosyltransferase
MGHRLSKIYTRTGDDGTTGLGDGNRVDKDSLRVEAFGTIDELNSQLGLVLACSPPPDINGLLIRIQHELFDLGGEISIPGREIISSVHVARLESELDKYNAGLQPLAEFILPGGSQIAAHCHVCRTVCRRAERRLVSLKRKETVSEHSLKYLNRLSDLLFVLARSLNAYEKKADVLWKPEQTKPADKK